MVCRKSELLLKKLAFVLYDKEGNVVETAGTHVGFREVEIVEKERINLKFSLMEHLLC